MSKYSELLKTHEVYEDGTIIKKAFIVIYKRRDKIIKYRRKAIELKQQTNDGGYKFISYKPPYVNKAFVHVLVAEKFLPKPKFKTEVNHIDGNKANNFLSNLERITPSENMKHAVKLGLFTKVYNGGKRKLEEADIRNIRKTNNVSDRQLGKQYGVHRSTISHIKKKIFYKNVASI